MAVYRIEVQTEGHEVYYVQADTPMEAQRQVNEGEVEPSVSEMTGGSIVTVEEADED